MAEWRTIRSSLFLNTIATVPDMRGRGVGTHLLRDGLKRWPSFDTIELDVFVSMDVATQWYRSLGFETMERHAWVFYPSLRANINGGSLKREPPGPAIADAKTVQWTNRDVATANHDAYGVSTLDFAVENHTRRVGRLGTDFFRITNAQTLRNRPIRQFLHRLNPDRQIVHREASPPVHDPFTGIEGRRIDTSTRMRALRTTILRAQR